MRRSTTSRTAARTRVRLMSPKRSAVNNRYLTCPTTATFKVWRFAS
ncbi:hypothetical protein [Actinoplanes sp. NBRC 103695]|nr:hypothetical protein [Actinoplanes sp. NBRC 103695]